MKKIIISILAITSISSAFADVRIGDSATTKQEFCNGSTCVDSTLVKTIVGVQGLNSSYPELLYQVKDENGKLIRADSMYLPDYLAKKKLLRDIPANCGGPLNYGYPQKEVNLALPAGNLKVCRTSTSSEFTSLLSVGDVPFFEVQKVQEYKDYNGYTIKDNNTLVSFEKGTGKIISN